MSSLDYIAAKKLHNPQKYIFSSLRLPERRFRRRNTAKKWESNVNCGKCVLKENPTQRCWPVDWVNIEWETAPPYRALKMLTAHCQRNFRMNEFPRALFSVVLSRSRSFFHNGRRRTRRRSSYSIHFQFTESVKVEFNEPCRLQKRSLLKITMEICSRHAWAKWDRSPTNWSK